MDPVLYYTTIYPQDFKNDLIQAMRGSTDGTSTSRITSVALRVIGASFCISAAVNGLTVIPLTILNPLWSIVVVISTIALAIVGHDLNSIGISIRTKLEADRELQLRQQQEIAQHQQTWWEYFVGDAPKAAEPEKPPERIPYYYNDTWILKELYDVVLTRYEQLKTGPEPQNIEMQEVD